MKTAAKVFIVLSIICFSIALLILIISLAVIFATIQDPGISQSEIQMVINTYVAFIIILSILLIASIVIAVFTFKALNRGMSKNQAILYGLLNLLLVNVISVILILVMDTEEDVNGISKSKNLSSDLTELNSLYEKGMITEEEYNDLKKKLIEKNFLK